MFGIGLIVIGVLVLIKECLTAGIKEGIRMAKRHED